MKTKTAASIAFGFALVLAGAGCNRDRSVVTPQNNPPSAASGSADRVGTALSETDRAFMLKAAQGGMTEVELGRLAQDKGASQAVKDYGKTLVADHTAANEKLRSIATDEAVILPSALDSKHQSDVDKFAKLS